MLGNHRDAWGYGSVDPSSGTAQLMEVARTFGEMLKKGWRPRRTIVLASWAAEEYGLEGIFLLLVLLILNSKMIFSLNHSQKFKSEIR